MAFIVAAVDDRRYTTNIEMNKLLAFAALAEASTGAALIVVPALVGQLLLGAELTGVAIPVARAFGIALIALGVACWPGRTALCGMLTYSVLITAFLAYLGIRAVWSGPLLWPAVGLHAVLTVLLARTWFANRRAGRSNNADKPSVNS